MTFRILLSLFVLNTSLFAQGIKVEYDKNHDFATYKTFAMGEGEIVTPQDQRKVKDATIHQWVKGALKEELQEKGLQLVDSAADLTVSYVIGSLDKLDVERLGPLGQTPGSDSQTWSRDYSQGSLIIDLNDRSNKKVWRINATTNSAAADAERMIDQVVTEGFKKFSIKPKKEKKKKKK